MENLVGITYVNRDELASIGLLLPRHMAKSELCFLDVTDQHQMRHRIRRERHEVTLEACAGHIIPCGAGTGTKLVRTN